MPRRILIVQGHPDPEQAHLCHALADAYAEGAEAAGHQVRRVEIAQLEFPLLRSQEDFMEHRPPEILRTAQESITWCEHLVLVFPLWLGGAPALVQGFMEQVFRPGFAYRYREKGFPEMLMKGRSARVVVTMGMPALMYRMWYLSHGVRRLTRSALGFVGFAPIRESQFGMVGSANEAKRRSWLDAMRELGRKGV